MNGREKTTRNVCDVINIFHNLKEEAKRLKNEKEKKN